MTTKKESSTFSSFIRQWNGLLQIGLLVAAFFNFMFGMTLPMPFNLIVAIGGCGLMAIASVLSASISMRYTIIKQNQEAQLKDFVQAEDKGQVLSLPPMRVLFIRNTLVLMLFVLTLTVLWGSLFGAIALTRSIAPERLGIIIGGGVAMGGILIAGYGSFLSFIAVSTVVDRYIYRHEAIRQAFYKGEADKNIKSLGLEFLKISGQIIGFGVLIGGITIPLIWFAAWIKSDNFKLDLPVYGYVLCIGAMMILPFAGLWWLYRSLFSPHAYKKIEDAVVKAHGADSEQAREYKKEVAQQSNSIEQQVMRNMMKWLFGGIAGFFVVMIVLRFVLIALPITGEQAQVVMTVAICLFMIAIFAFFTRGTGLLTKGIQHPEEYQKIDDAIKQGNYAAAQQYAEIVREKKPPAEANFVVAMTYAMGGKFDIAERSCRDALKLLLVHEDEKRRTLNAFFITQYLWFLAAILIASQRYEEAEEALHQALTHDSKQVPVYGNLAEVALHRGYNGQIALDYLEKAFELNAKLPEMERTKMLSARLLKAWALSRLGERKAAFELIQAVFHEAELNNVPMMGELHYISGRIAMEQGKTVTAQSAFHKSLQNDPEGMYNQLAKTMLQQL